MHEASPPDIVIELSIEKVEPKLRYLPNTEAHYVGDEYVIQAPSGSIMTIQIVADGFKLIRNRLSAVI
ncbi:hypothetical protein AAVH_38464 [Aphelenchoides avenae]|nr:hypothetical protein AAVH_38464 [Aphelenchus avenae]